MLSRRQFFSITVIMLVLLVMFQLTGVMKDYWNDYQTNEYANNSLDTKWQNAFESISDEDALKENYVVFIGDTNDTNVGKMVELWCKYSKKNILSYDSFDNVSENIADNCDFFILDSEFIDFNADPERLLTYAKEGKSMIFCNLPDVSVVKSNQDLFNLLGIYTVYEDMVTVNGLDLYDGFLLGGRTIYESTNDVDEKRQNLNLQMPWYATYANVKRYMIGIVDEDALGSDEEVKNEDMPSVIWRNNIGKARIFVVNGNFMETVTALGILSAMEYEMNDYLLYPVVNAQNVSVINFAAFSDETDDVMDEEYARTQQAVFQDLVWPSLNSIFTRTEDKPTFFLNPQLDYSDNEDAKEDKLVYYMKLFGEARAEAALTTLQSSDVSIDKKLEKDMEFYQNNIPGYSFTSIYMSEDDLNDADSINLPESIRTIGLENKYDEAPIAYSEDGMVMQRAISDGFDYKYSDDLRLKSIQTALAYSNILVDMECILYSDNDEDTWEHSSERLASNVITFWKPFSVFNKTVITESDEKVRNFLNLNYKDSKDENIISLNIDEFNEEASFILRTHNETIEKAEGASFEEIEEHAYLIRATQAQIKIYLKEEISTFIH